MFRCPKCNSQTFRLEVHEQDYAIIEDNIVHVVVLEKEDIVISLDEVYSKAICSSCGADVSKEFFEFARKAQVIWE